VSMTPVVSINVEQVKNKLIIKIKDNGIGIDKKMHHDIFKMFFRGHYQSTGIGLGLYIVKTSVDTLKGKISVKSRVGHGSTFTVTIPVNKAKISAPVS
jgi:signal transduction histidine kinase